MELSAWPNSWNSVTTCNRTQGLSFTTRIESMFEVHLGFEVHSSLENLMLFPCFTPF